MARISSHGAANPSHSDASSVIRLLAAARYYFSGLFRPYDLGKDALESFGRIIALSLARGLLETI